MFETVPIPRRTATREGGTSPRAAAIPQTGPLAASFFSLAPGRFGPAGPKDSGRLGALQCLGCRSGREWRRRQGGPAGAAQSGGRTRSRAASGAAAGKTTPARLTPLPVAPPLPTNQISAGGKTTSLGDHDTEVAAARAFDRAAINKVRAEKRRAYLPCPFFRPHDTCSLPPFIFFLSLYSHSTAVTPRPTSRWPSMARRSPN